MSKTLVSSVEGGGKHEHVHIRSNSLWSENSKKSSRTVLWTLVFTWNILEGYTCNSYEKHDDLNFKL